MIDSDRAESRRLNTSPVGFHAVSNSIGPFLTPTGGYPLRWMHSVGWFIGYDRYDRSLSCRISDIGDTL